MEEECGRSLNSIISFARAAKMCGPASTILPTVQGCSSLDFLKFSSGPAGSILTQQSLRGVRVCFGMS
jgi:hypothetical protein